MSMLSLVLADCTFLSANKPY
ncbi:superoxide dismutase, partial [Francisella tularensis subsp. holarctica]|nr:superoxide dismutase [Francisella tularensis subsp. holarctica]